MIIKCKLYMMQSSVRDELKLSKAFPGVLRSFRDGFHEKSPQVAEGKVFSGK
jgi:hypothetical protein